MRSRAANWKALLLLLAAFSLVQAQGVYVDDNGTLREITGIYVNDNGTLRDIQSGWVNDNGTLRQFFSKITLSGGTGGTVSETDVGSPFDTTVGIRFNTDGTIEKGTSVNGAGISWSSAGSWIDPESAASSAYDVRFTNLVVNTGAGDWTAEAEADDQWIAISSTRTWTANRTSAGSWDFDCDFEVRANAGPPPATGSASYTFTIDNEI